MKLILDKKYLKIPTNSFATIKKICLYRDGELILDLDCKLDLINPDFIAYVDVSRFAGAEVEYKSIPEIDFRLECVDEREYDNLYAEEFRPFVHFTPASGWMNDPNGLIKYRGTYHMFFQHNPCGTEWGNMHWGHAKSRDLLHWEELDIALSPDELGTMYSGSAIEDTRNLTGLKSGEENPVLLYYTAAGDRTLLAKNRERTQCLAYSLDGGKTFEKYDKNPVLGHIESYNRDPKIVFVPEISKHLMVLYLVDDRYALLTSDNLCDWEMMQEISLKNDAECPDIYNFTQGQTSRWVIIGASDTYITGVFEKGKFVRKSTEKRLSYTESSSSYAGQSFSGLDDGRTVRLVWDQLRMPSARVPHQMGFPTEMNLVPHNGDVYLTANPIREIENLYVSTVSEKNFELGAAEKSFPLERAAYDIFFEAEFKNQITLRLFGLELQIKPAENSIVRGKHKIPISLDLDSVKLRIIVDRCSVELFADDGKFIATIPFWCDYNLPDITLSSPQGTKVSEITINRLKSVHST